MAQAEHGQFACAQNIVKTSYMLLYQNHAMAAHPRQIGLLPDDLHVVQMDLAPVQLRLKHSNHAASKRPS